MIFHRCHALPKGISSNIESQPGKADPLWSQLGPGIAVSRLNDPHLGQICWFLQVSTTIQGSQHRPLARSATCYRLLYPGFGCLVLTHHGWFIISLVRRVEQEAGPQMFCPVATEAEASGGQLLGEHVMFHAFRGP